MERLKKMNTKKIQQDGFMCEAELHVKDKTYQTFLTLDPIYDKMKMNINGVNINIEIDGGLYIEDMENYTVEQLSFLSLDDTRRDNGLLTDYVFKTRIPVELIDKQNNEIISEYLNIEIKRTGFCGDQSSKDSYQYRILNASYSYTDYGSSFYLEDAFHDIQAQLKERYILRICACCKYGQGNPYYSSYANFLCFKRNKTDYLKYYPNGVEKTDWEFIKNKSDDTKQLFNCDEFEPFSDK